VPFTIQEAARKPAAICHVDDLVAGVMLIRAKGETSASIMSEPTEEVAIADLSRTSRTRGRLSDCIAAVGCPCRQHAAPDARYCKLAALGYRPRVFPSTRACRRCSNGIGTTRHGAAA